MKVLVADLFSKDGLKELEAAGIDFKYDDKLNGDSLKQAMSEY